ncbi:hypothetical protein NMY22_g12790 [Coprinellus aureogranulatus]|nr:hypothetical protein NMY22_g12790 [Coprinellus aureogranulatus]
MLLKLFPILFLHVAPHAFGWMSEDPPIVDLGYARYQGVSNVETGNTEFLGIRYAAPPTGKARWREPRLPDRVDVLQKADTQPNRCQQAFGSVDRPNIQKSGVDATTAYGEGSQQVLGQSNVQWGSVVPPVSEDCLFLNVVTPGLNFSSTSSEKLPVVVWIHGGGYALGSISFPGVNGMRIYDGNDLVNDSGGKVIAVLIQYRLGLFGFLAGSDVKKDGVLNAGLRDQQFALEWIQRHVSDTLSLNTVPHLRSPPSLSLPRLRLSPSPVPLCYISLDLGHLNPTQFPSLFERGSAFSSVVLHVLPSRSPSPPSMFPRPLGIVLIILYYSGKS